MRFSSAAASCSLVVGRAGAARVPARCAPSAREEPRSETAGTAARRRRQRLCFARSSWPLRQGQPDARAEHLGPAHDGHELPASTSPAAASPERPLTRRRPTRTAGAVNLRASDVPGFVPTSRALAGSVGGEKQLEEQLARCAGVRSGSSHSGTLGIGLAAVPAPRRAAGRQRELVGQLPAHGGRWRNGTEAPAQRSPAHVPEPLPRGAPARASSSAARRVGQVSIVQGTPPAPGTTGGFGWRVTAVFMVRNLKVPFYLDTLGFIDGRAQVTLQSSGVAVPFPAAAEEHLFTLLLSARPRATPLAPSAAAHGGRGARRSAPCAPTSACRARAASGRRDHAHRRRRALIGGARAGPSCARPSSAAASARRRQMCSRRPSRAPSGIAKPTMATGDQTDAPPSSEPLARLTATTIVPSHPGALPVHEGGPGPGRGGRPRPRRQARSLRSGSERGRGARRRPARHRRRRAPLAADRSRARQRPRPLRCSAGRPRLLRGRRPTATCSWTVTLSPHASRDRQRDFVAAGARVGVLRRFAARLGRAVPEVPAVFGDACAVGAFGHADERHRLAGCRRARRHAALRRWERAVRRP